MDARGIGGAEWVERVRSLRGCAFGEWEHRVVRVRARHGVSTVYM